MKGALTLSLVIFLFQLKAQNWQTLNLPTTSNIKSSSFINDDEGWIGFDNASAATSLYHTGDGGITWNAVSVPGANSGTSYVDFVNEFTGYAVIGEAAYKTEDGGISWAQLTLPGIPAFNPCFINTDTGFINCKDQYIVFKTMDGGITWNAYDTYYGNFYNMQFLNDSVGGAAEYDGYIFITNDGGEYLNVVNDGGLWSYFNAMCFASDGKMYYTGYTDVFGEYSIEIYGGPEIYSSTTISDLLGIRFFTSYRGYGVGGGGQIVKTENGGLTWEDYHISAPTLTVIDGFQDIYVFGNNGKGFKLPHYCTIAPIFYFSVTDLEVMFTDSSLNAASWLWDFGDGTTSTDQSPIHTFALEGDYDICLTIENDSCGSSTLCQVVKVCFPNTSASPAGSLDVSFGNGGIATDISFVPHDPITSLAIQADGKIIASGGPAQPSIARYNTNGTPDSSFAGDGSIDNIYISYGSSSGTVLQQDGKIILAGIYDQDLTQLIRFMPDGSLDSTFGINASVIIDLSEQNHQNNFISMAIQPDGKLMVYGYAYSVSHIVARFNLDGSLDSSFAGDGIAGFASMNEASAKDGDMAIQQDGRILLCGSSMDDNENFSVIRLNPNGTVDSTFGNAGVVKTDMTSGTYDYDIARSVLVQTDGKILAVGTGKSFSSKENYAIARLHPDGNLDSSFGIDGKLVFQIEEEPSHASDAALEADGKILIAGWFGDDYEWRIGLVRLNTNGGVDSTFGTNGIVITQANCDITLAFSIALDGDSIYVGGRNYYSGPFLLARYLSGCPSPLSDFTYALTDLAAGFTVQIQYADSWFWDFGDGNTSTDQNPIHLYALPGIYNVCLVATNDCSGDTSCQTIAILATSLIEQAIDGLSFVVYPNPFSESATIKFFIEKDSDLKIELHDLQGRKNKNNWR